MEPITCNSQPVPTTVIYQAAKLGDVSYLLGDFELAQRLDAEGMPIGRIYGNSSGALVAVAHAIVLAARADPQRWAPQATHALADFVAFFRRARSRDIRRLNWRGLRYGIYHLDPLRRWLTERLREYTGSADVSGWMISRLFPSLYLCTQDKDGFPVLFGPPDERLHAVYHSCSTRVEDAPLVDACIAALSTMLSTDAALVNGHYYKDGRPAFADISSIVRDMESSDPRPVVKSTPYTPLPSWKGNTITQVFIMHAWHERNHAEMADYYNALLDRRRDLLQQYGGGGESDPDCPRVLHVDIPYIGSTEAGTNLRDSVANKASLMEQFRQIGLPQLERFDFSRPFNLVYGAGGFSGILAGLVMTRAVDERGGAVRRIFGCSAGVLNGLFHGVVLGARRHPELYMPAALDALSDLETFFEQLEPAKLFRFNKTPRRLARALTDWSPLRQQLARYIERWTGRPDGAEVTFEDIQLPFYAAGARGSDGYADFFGLPDGLEMEYAGRRIRPVNCRIVDAIVGGMAQPFYVTPPVIDGETYFDGGGAFYDICLFAAALEPEPISLLSLHFAEPPGHSYGFDERMHLLRILFDTHNFTLPEERRRMRRLVDLWYECVALKRRGLTLALGQDNTNGDQHSGGQCKNAISPVLPFDRGQQVGGAHIDQRASRDGQQDAQSGPLDPVDKGIRYQRAQRGR